MARRKMTKGDEARIAARKALVEIKRTVPTGRMDPETGRPATERKSFYGQTKEDAQGKLRIYLATLNAGVPKPGPLEPGTIDWYLVNRIAPFHAGDKLNTQRAIQNASDHLSHHAGWIQAKDFDDVTL
ncbi:MAG: hypothetical protein EOP84_13150, partial [Verrucomicrobiaceae bacterium]